jgi:hypothetical protein
VEIESGGMVTFVLQSLHVHTAREETAVNCEQVARHEARRF